MDEILDNPGVKPGYLLVQSTSVIRNSVIRKLAYKKAKILSRPKLFFVMTYRNSVIRNSVIRKLGYKKHDSLVPTRFSLGYKKLFISLIYPIVAKIVGTPQMTWQPVFSIPLSSLFSYRLVNLTNNKSLMSYISCCHSGRVGSSPPTRAKK